MPRFQALKAQKSTATPVNMFKDEVYFEQLAQAVETVDSMIYCETEYYEHEDNEHFEFALQVALIRNVMENIAEKSTPHDKKQMARYHGQKHFKCSRVGCHFFHEGFETSEERYKHLVEHQRPFRCTEIGCHMNLIGYKTEKQLRKHNMLKYLETADDYSISFFQEPSSIDIYKEIKSGNDEALDIWMDQFEGLIPLDVLWDSANRRSQGPLRGAIETGNLDVPVAVLDGSEPALLRTPAGTEPLPSAIYLLREAIKAHNETAVEEILRRNTPLHDRDAIFALYNTALKQGLDHAAIAISSRGCKYSANDRSEQRRASYLSAAVRNKRYAVVRDLVRVKKVSPFVGFESEEL